jgi:hypothetical protein
MFFSLVLAQQPFKATRKWLVEKYSMNVCVEWTQLAHNEPFEKPQRQLSEYIRFQQISYTGVIKTFFR